jgi:hypothetical protein
LRGRSRREDRAASNSLALDLSHGRISAIRSPLAFTEQAIAASHRDAQSLTQSDESFRNIVKEVSRFSAADYIRVGYGRVALQNIFVDLFSGFDILVTPTRGDHALPGRRLGR